MYRSPFTLLYFTGSINGYRRRNYNTIGFRGGGGKAEELGEFGFVYGSEGEGGGWEEKRKKRGKGIDRNRTRTGMV